MGDMLSQDEINALLGGLGSDLDIDAGVDESSQDNEDSRNFLTPEQKDILGEIGNISMGTSATTLFALLGQKVLINTPVVRIMNWTQLSESHNRPCVGIRVDYKEGIKGSNVLILKQRDVKIISNLMMGGDGNIVDDFDLNEIDLSAIAEAMNQMVGSSSTSLASLVKIKIDIDTPHAFMIDFNDDNYFEDIGFSDEDIVTISFKMEIGTLINSEIMQILPVQFALDMVEKLKHELFSSAPKSPAPAAPTPAPSQPTQDYSGASQGSAPSSGYGAQPQQPQMQQMPPQMDYSQQYPPYPAQPPYGQPNMYQQDYGQQPYPPQGYGQPPYGYAPYPQSAPPQPQAPYPAQISQQQQSSYTPPQNVNVQAAQFQNFDTSALIQQKENIGIIMDVPLEVTVELGRTTKKIKEILEFSPGTVVELDKLAGEPINILVNGKYIARGEVVVIDENFGIRISDIISPEKRI